MCFHVSPANQWLECEGIELFSLDKELILFVKISLSRRMLSL